MHDGGDSLHRSHRGVGQGSVGALYLQLVLFVADDHNHFVDVRAEDDVHPQLATVVEPQDTLVCEIAYNQEPKVDAVGYSWEEAFDQDPSEGLTYLTESHPQA